MNNLDIYRKIADENFDFDNYRTIRELIRVYCFENVKLSKQLIIMNLKQYLSCECATYALKELALIKDSHSEFRRNCIFGFPSVNDTKENYRKPMFGL